MTTSTEDLLSRIVRLSPKMSPAERRVADLVLSDMEFAVHTPHHRHRVAGRSERGHRHPVLPLRRLPGDCGS